MLEQELLVIDIGAVEVPPPEDAQGVAQEEEREPEPTDVAQNKSPELSTDSDLEDLTDEIERARREIEAKRRQDALRSIGLCGVDVEADDGGAGPSLVDRDFCDAVRIVEQKKRAHFNVIDDIEL